MGKTLICNFYLIISVIAFSKVHAQEKNALKPKDTVVYDFIFVGAKVQDKFTFMGRDFGQQIPFLSTDLMYAFNSNIWVGSSLYKFFDSEIPIQASLSAGYNRAITSKIDASLSYSQYVISDDGQVSGLQSQGIVQAIVGLDWNYLYSTLQTQVMLNQSPDVFITSNHSRYFEFNKKLFKKITVSFEPLLSLTLGSNKFYYNDEENWIIPGRGFVTPPGLLKKGTNGNNGNGRANNAGTGNNSGGGNSGGGNNGGGNSGGGNSGGGNSGGGNSGGGNSGGGNSGGGNAGGGNAGGNNTGGNPSGNNAGGIGNGNNVNSNTTTTNPEQPPSQIKLLNWEATLPVTFQWGKITMEIFSRYTAPLNVVDGDPSKPTFLHGVEFYYQIPVRKHKRIKP